MTSLYKLAEQAKSLIGERVEMQELIEACRQSYGTAAKLLWFGNKKADLSEIDGSTVFTFKDLAPELDTDTDQYFTELPSSYVGLPHEMGVVQVSYMKSQNRPFVRMPNGTIGLIGNLKSFSLGNNQAYTVDGKNLVFPKMKILDVGNILLKLSVGVDGVDPEDEINIPLDVQDQIVQMVVAKFNPKPSGDQTLNNG